MDADGKEEAITFISRSQADKISRVQDAILAPDTHPIW